MRDTVPAVMPVDVDRYRCDAPGCDAVLIADRDLSGAGWYTLTASHLQGPTLNQTGIVYFDSLDHAVAWLAAQRGV